MWVDEKTEIDVASDCNVMEIEYECAKEKVSMNAERKGRYRVREAD